jgi:hypothetical protein
MVAKRDIQNILFIQKRTKCFIYIIGVYSITYYYMEDVM